VKVYIVKGLVFFSIPLLIHLSYRRFSF